MKVSVLLVLLLTAGGLAAQSPSAEQTGEVEKIGEVLRRFEEAFNRGDSAAIGELYTQDADRIDGAGSLATGRAAVRDGYEQSFAARAPRVLPEADRLSFEASNIRLLGSEVAILDGATLRRGVHLGDFTIVLEKVGDDWLFDAARMRNLAARSRTRGPREESKP